LHGVTPCAESGKAAILPERGQFSGCLGRRPWQTRGKAAAGGQGSAIKSHSTERPVGPVQTGSCQMTKAELVTGSLGNLPLGQFPQLGLSRS
jgi:hypothetical protein